MCYQPLSGKYRRNNRHLWKQIRCFLQVLDFLITVFLRSGAKDLAGFTDRIVRPLGSLLVIGMLIWFVVSVRAVLTPFIIGFFIAYLLEPFVDFLEKYRISRRAAIVLIYLFFALTIGMLVFYALPVLLRDLNRMVEVVPQYTENMQKMIREIKIGYNRVPLPESIRQVGDETIKRVEMMILAVVQGFAGALLGLFSQAFNLVLAPILSFYFLLEYNCLGRGLLCLAPVRFRPELEKVGQEINQVIKKFIRANLLVAFLVAIMATVGMILVGMEFPLLIGILVGVTNLIPYFGAIISTLAATMLALLKSKWLALYVLGMMVLVQQIEGNIIAPKILGDCVGLHPLVIIFALLAGGQLWGVPGLLLAVPMAGILKVLLKHLYLRFV